MPNYPTTGYIVAAGEGIRERAGEGKAKGEYLKAPAVQASAIETAEGTTEAPTPRR